MTDQNVTAVKQAKFEVWNAYHGRVRALGCNLAHGIGWNDLGDFTISLHITKNEGINESLIKKLETLLPSEYKGYKVNKIYEKISIV